MSSYFDYFCKNLENNNSNDNEFIKGTCCSMCPQEEIILREKERLVHILEVTGPVRKLVKCYCRSAADSNMTVPRLLRPFSVLQDTVNYLLLVLRVKSNECTFVSCRVISVTEFCWADGSKLFSCYPTQVTKRNDVSTPVLYDFITDRLRAVRQDMTIQRLPPHECVQLLEPMIRFHVFYGYILCNHPLKDYDPVLNKKYLLECIKWFLSSCDKIDQSENGSRIDDLSQFMSNINIKEGYNKLPCDRVLMESLYILCNLDDVHPLLRCLSLPKEIKINPRLNFVFKIALAHLKGNYVKVCKMLDSLCPRSYCALSVYLPVLQRRALLVMCHAYNSKSLTVASDAVRRWLHFASEESARATCAHYGLAGEGGAHYGLAGEGGAHYGLAGEGGAHYGLAGEGGARALIFDKGEFKGDAPLHQVTIQASKNRNFNIEHIFTYTTIKE